jgi:hypothetical protein
LGKVVRDDCRGGQFAACGERDRARGSGDASYSLAHRPGDSDLLPVFPIPGVGVMIFISAKLNKP